jgi:hypothetical protein
MTARSGKPEDEILKIMAKETFINAQEALEYGLCDEIEPSSEQNRKRMAGTPQTAYYKEAKLVLNSIIEPKTNKNMKQVCAKLGLDGEANEGSIVNAIERIQNKAKEEKESYEDKIKALRKQKDDLEDQIDKLKREKADAEDKAKEENAKNVVNTYVKAGRIKNDAETLKFWTAIVKADAETGKKQLDALPINKIGVNIQNSAYAENDILLTSVATRAMAEVRNKLKI